jgi:ligand-binding sensor domain-containing protein
MLQDSNGEMWVSTDSGINIINVQEKTIRYLVSGGKVSDDNGGTMLTDDQGRVWIGTRNNIYIADSKKNLLTTITT